MLRILYLQLLLCGCLTATFLTGCQPSDGQKEALTKIDPPRPKVLVPDEVDVSVQARSEKATDEAVVKSVGQLLKNLKQFGETNPNRNLVWSSDWMLLVVGLDERAKRPGGKGIRKAAAEWSVELSSVAVNCEAQAIPEACLAERYAHLECIQWLQKIAGPNSTLRPASTDSLANEIRRLRAVVEKRYLEEKDLSESQYKSVLTEARQARK
jgi:hypothetical protein